MRLILQRVKSASVSFEDGQKRQIEAGLVILAGFSKDDDESVLRPMFDKILNMRIFSDSNGKFNFSIKDISGQILIVSQFTLYASCRKGNRPDFLEASPFNEARKLYKAFIDLFNGSGLVFKTGEFGADMLVEINNDGPVTIILDSNDYKK
jgi:D-tyrosyl-tRNA(Tyr) deacylase